MWLKLEERLIKSVVKTLGFKINVLKIGLLFYFILLICIMRTFTLLKYLSYSLTQ